MDCGMFGLLLGNTASRGVGSHRGIADD